MLQPTDTFWSTFALWHAVEEGRSGDFGGDGPVHPRQGCGDPSPIQTFPTVMMGDTALVPPRQPTDEEIERYDIWTYVVGDFGHT